MPSSIKKIQRTNNLNDKLEVVEKDEGKAHSITSMTQGNFDKSTLRNLETNPLHTLIVTCFIRNICTKASIREEKQNSNEF